MKTLVKILAASAVALALPLVTFAATYTWTWTTGTPASQVSYTQLPNAQNSGVNSNQSLNWSGYVSTNGPFTSVNGTWTVPSVASVNSTMADATWVGIGGVTSRNLIQAGTQAITDPSGSVAYAAWYELLPDDMQQISLPIHAGDSISVSINETATNIWLVSFTDHTTGGTYQTSLSYASDESSAEWIEEMPTANIGVLPLDNFGAISFSSGTATVNGTTETISGTGARPITMITQNGSALATPSSLGSDGASFTVTRSSAAASTATVSGFGHGSWHRIGVDVGGFGHRTTTTTPTSGATTGSSGTGTGTNTVTINFRRWSQLPPQQIMQLLRSQFSQFGQFSFIRF